MGKAHKVKLDVYRARTTTTFPQAEFCGLTSQMPRWAVSRESNLIEDKGREIDPKFRRFIEIPAGSPVEPDGLLLVAKDLGYLHESEYAKLNSNLAEVERMLISLRGSARIASAAN